MLLAQAETVGRVVDAATKSASDYGLVGILLVLVLVACGGFLVMVCRFLAPLLRDAIASTVDLHTSIKETNLTLTVTLDKITDDHGSKLSDIKEVVGKLKGCQYAGGQQVPLQPIPGG